MDSNNVNLKRTKARESIKQISQAVYRIIGDAKDNTFKENCLQVIDVIKCLLSFFQLKPVERLALRFVESTNTYAVEDEVEETEKMLEEKKKEWELNHLQSLKVFVISCCSSTIFYFMIVP